MCCAQFLINVFGSCFDFWHCVGNYVVALFFAMILCAPCLIFWSQFLTFALFALYKFSLVPLRGFRNFPDHVLLLFVLQTFSCIDLVTAICFVLFTNFFLILLLGLVLAFFGVKIGVLHQFIIACFAFFVHFLWLCALALLIHSYTSLLHSLTAQNYAYCPLCSFFGKAKVSLIWLPWSCITKYCITLAFVHLFALFCVPPVSINPIAPIRIHFYPSAPIHVHLCIATIKHDVRGNFPGHSAKIMHCTIIFVSACLVFVSPRTHAPYRTHLNPSAPICTHLHSLKH